MFFVAVSFSDSKISELFDLVRLLAEPDYARSAHITLRGPYSHKKDIGSSIFEKDVGKITIRKAGSFFNERQSTVFLGVEILGVSDFWYKPDFPEGTPHLSVYDGGDRKTAWVIFNTLQKFKWNLSLNSTPMHVLEKKRPLETEYLVQYEKVSRTLFDIAGRQIDATEMRNISLFERVSMLVKACDRIHQLSNS